MEAASNSVRTILSVLSDEENVGDALLKFTRQLEEDYLESQDITLFIFALRTFFCWHRSHELAEDPEKVKKIQAEWLHHNDALYTTWLTSKKDHHVELLWAKWTFQAKNSILLEFLEGANKKE
jgi:hypothetical protein